MLFSLKILIAKIRWFYLRLLIYKTKGNNANKFKMFRTRFKLDLNCLICHKETNKV